MGKQCLSGDFQADYQEDYFAYCQTMWLNTMSLSKECLSFFLPQWIENQSKTQKYNRSISFAVLRQKLYFLFLPSNYTHITVPYLRSVKSARLLTLAIIYCDVVVHVTYSSLTESIRRLHWYYWGATRFCKRHFWTPLSDLVACRTNHAQTWLVAMLPFRGRPSVYVVGARV